MKNRLASILAATSVGLGACAVYPEHDPYYDPPVVRVAPPPVPYEHPGYPPVVGHVWITGYWNWVGVRYVWVPGRWEAPRPGYYWMPHRWEHQGDHWRPHGGRWERDLHPQAPPPRIERHDAPRLAPPPASRVAPPPEPRVAPSPPPRIEQRESRRGPAESLPPQQRRSEPRVEQGVRPAPERNGGPRVERGDRDERRHPHPDDESRGRRPGPDEAR